MSNAFTELIRREFMTRKSHNSRYSLRAFSRYLGVHPSTLSRILAGNQGISEKLIDRIASKLGLSPSEIAQFRSLHGDSKRTIKPVLLDLDTFLKVTDLTHYSVLNLLILKSFKPDPLWIANKLQIPVKDARRAWKMLKQAELIRQDLDGRWVRTHADTTNIPESKVKILAYRDLQIQILKKAIEALHEIGGDRRDNSALTIAIDSRRLPEAMRRITKFRRELSAFLTGGEPDQVYSVAIALFPLTKGLTN